MCRGVRVLTNENVMEEVKRMSWSGNVRRLTRVGHVEWER